MNKKNLFALGILVFLIFVFLSYLVQKNLFTQLDFNNTVKLQDHLSRRFDTPFSVFSLLGSAEVSTIFLLAIIIARRKLKTFFVFGGYAMGLFFELFGKIFVKHPGPPYLFFRYDIPFDFPSSYVKPGSSYPSGHSTRTTFISVLLLLIIWKSKKLSNSQKTLFSLLVISFDVIMLLSRVYLGEHWTTDVVGGGLLGASLAMISFMFL